MLYLLDANVLILAQNTYYEFGRVNQYWEWLKFNAEKGLVKIPIDIHEEITAKDDNLAEWAKEFRTDLALEEEVDPELLSRVIEIGYAPDLQRKDIGKIGKDPFLIAHALANIGERIVVTGERRSSKMKGYKRKIPNVCDDLGIACCDQWRLGRDLNFRTDWNRF